MVQEEDGKQIALWAYRLTFFHPVTKKEISFTSVPEINGTWKILEDLMSMKFENVPKFFKHKP